MFWPPDDRTDSPTAVQSGAPGGAPVAVVVPPLSLNASAGAPSTGLYSPVMLTWTRCQFVVGFAIPFTVIVAAYAALGIRLRRLLAARSNGGDARGKTAAGDGGSDGIVVIVGGGGGRGNSVKGRNARRKMARKTAVKRPGRAMTRMTIVVTLTFLVTQLPYHVVEMMNASKAEQLHNMAMRHSTSLVVDGNRRRLAVVDECGNLTHQKFCSSTEFGDGSSSSSEDFYSGDTMVTSVPVTMPVVTLSPATDRELSAFIWLSAVAKMLQFVSTCFNPVIYGLMNRNYRK
jgi:preprotein translocase subunit SecG